MPQSYGALASSCEDGGDLAPLLEQAREQPRPRRGAKTVGAVLVLTGVLPAVAKRLIEWTKVAAMAERPAGVLFWTIADWLAVALTRTLLPLPPAPEAAEEGALPAAALV